MPSKPTDTPNLPLPLGAASSTPSFPLASGATESSLARAAAAGKATAAAGSGPSQEADGFVFFEAMDYNREEGIGKRTLDASNAVGEYEPLKQNFIPLALAANFNAWGLPQHQHLQQQAPPQNVSLPPDGSDDESI
jgi:hypothetical protein